MKDYGVAEICLNGHILDYKLNDVVLSTKFCEACGDPIINLCPVCLTPVKGGVRYESQITPPFAYYGNPYKRPSYCYKCGNPFPWTVRAQEAALELIDFAEELDNVDKDDFKGSIIHLVNETPKTSTAIMKFKKYSLKAGGETG